MRLDFANERVLGVVAHPDDAELLCAGTLARARADGAAIGLCVLCQGDKGQPSQNIENLARVRGAEMQAAADLLGAELMRGDIPDSTLRDDDATRSLLVTLLRRFRPTLMLGHAPPDYHTDHRAASQLVDTCSWLCASQGYQRDTLPVERPPAVWHMDTIGMQGFEPTLFVDVGASVDLKERMLACHKSQLQRTGDADFAPLAELMRQQLTTRGAQAGVTAAEAFRPHHVFKRTRAW